MDDHGLLMSSQYENLKGCSFISSLNSPAYFEAVALSQSLFSPFFPGWLIEAVMRCVRPCLHCALLSGLSLVIISVTALFAQHG